MSSDTAATADIAVGGCICEQVRYEIHGPPPGTWICHCLSCRKASGSICMANSFIKLKQWKITKGKDELHMFKDYNTSSGEPFFSYFCKTCSCLIYTSSDDLEKQSAIVVPSGSLDAPLDWKPQQEFWCIRRSAWLPPIEGTQRFDKNPQF
ncbi:hypothetical protein V8E36_007233 [Tilletia maclaganii]